MAGKHETYWEVLCPLDTLVIFLINLEFNVFIMIILRCLVQIHLRATSIFSLTLDIYARKFTSLNGIE